MAQSRIGSAARAQSSRNKRISHTRTIPKTSPRAGPTRMPPKACTICGQPANGPYCTTHQPPNRNTSAHGYGWAHRQRRKQLIESASGLTCTLCGQPMTAGQAVDLHHTTPRRHNPNSKGDTIVHAHCNRGAHRHRAT